MPVGSGRADANATSPASVVSTRRRDSAEVDKRANASREAVGFGQVDNVPAARPLLELDAGHDPAQVGTVLAGGLLAKHREDRHVDRIGDPIVSDLHLLGLRADERIPIHLEAAALIQATPQTAAGSARDSSRTRGGARRRSKQAG